MQTKNCKTCALKNNCPYLKNFNIDKNIGCVDWQDVEYHNTTISNNANKEDK